MADEPMIKEFFPPTVEDALRRSARAARAVVAAAVAEVERLNGCVDPDCEMDGCWIGGMGDSSRQVIEDAVAFLNEETS